MKGLENDSIYFVEGKTNQVSTEHISIDPIEVREDLLNKQMNETMSNGDYEEDLEDKIDHRVYRKTLDKPDFFERSKYLQSIFPSAQIEKPGGDYYGLTTCVLFILAVFVWTGYDKINTQKKDILGKAGEASNIFTTDTSIALLGTFSLIIIERFINRSNVIQAEGKPVPFDKMEMQEELNEIKTNQFSMQGSRTMTSSMTMKTMKTIKTGEIQAGGESQGLIDQMYQNADDDE